MEGYPEIENAETTWLTGEGAVTLAGVFADAGLAPPPVPPSLAGALDTLDPWLWGTEQPTVPLAAFDLQAENVLQDWDRDRLLIAHDGHGIGSWCIHYVLKLGSLAILVQRPWGGPSGDEEAEARAIAETFAQIDAILTAPRCNARNGDVLIIIDGLHVGLVGNGLKDGEVQLDETAEPLATACALLGVAPAGPGGTSPRHEVIQA